jgi:riboflavin biosynthesis pyrimidine reductase
MGEQEFVGWIRTRNNGRRTSEMRKSNIPLRIVLSISNRTPDKRRFRVQKQDHMLVCDEPRDHREILIKREVVPHKDPNGTLPTRRECAE